ncbi:methyl-accepting chemotaxis protein [Ectobacillus ponti]|uniref:Methyl-accepting chemotaxis protein n=1 Tax=Ectobacillus ponti TaxID=2961894 RepID=A0AA41X5T4_9BACI|nr:methyl-accepting chemotaxis protein [Ectobacillus ponti]MCP8969464.1 methyl-accepting chemotaxis protein [Ectobacillus ponti]
MRFSIRTKLLSGFLALALLVGVTGGVSYAYIQKLESSYGDMINRVNVILMNLKDIQYNAAQQVSFLRGYLLDPVKFKENADKVRNSNKEVARLIDETLPKVHVAEVRSSLEQLKKYNEQFAKEAEEAVLIAGTNLPEAVKNANEQVIPFGIDMRTLAEQTDKKQYDVMKEAMQKNETMIRTAVTEILLVTMAALALAVVVALIISRMIVRPLRALTSSAQAVAAGDLTADEVRLANTDELGVLARAFNEMKQSLHTLIAEVNQSAVQLSGVTGHISLSMQETELAAQQVASAVVTVSEGAEKQSSHSSSILDMVNSSLDQLTVGLEKAELTKQNAAVSSRMAREGSVAIQEAIRNLGNVTRTVDFATDAIQKLGRRSEEIGGIITTITGISNQTNLLALNAAIEAARAGENGRGFAIVAEEVRKLAEQSKEAADLITGLISDIQAETSVTVRTMESNSEAVNLQVGVLERGGQALEEIVAVVERTEGETREVEQILLQTSQTSTAVRQSVEEIASVIEEAAAVAEEVAASAEEQSATIQGITENSVQLSHMAERLQERVRRFKI